MREGFSFIRESTSLFRKGFSLLWDGLSFIQESTSLFRNGFLLLRYYEMVSRLFEKVPRYFEKVSITSWFLVYSRKYLVISKRFLVIRDSTSLLVHLSGRLTRWAYNIPMVRRPSSSTLSNLNISEASRPVLIKFYV